MKTLAEIELENYRSFTNARVCFQDIICVVGANESGKTNLLEAIFHLAPQKQFKAFTPSELRMGAPGYPKGEVKLTYSIVLTELLLGNHAATFPHIAGRVFRLTKRGEPECPPVWECDAQLPQSSIPDLIEINKKARFKQFFDRTTTERKRAKLRSERGWFVKDSSVDLRRGPFKTLLQEGAIQVFTGREKAACVLKILTPIILENMSLFQWSYQERDFLPERVNIDEFLNDINKFPTVASMFEICAWKRTEFRSYLTGKDDTVYGNLFEAVQRKMNSLIRNNWSTHSKLELELQHKGHYFTMHLREPGSRTPPEYRSDGLKWFLTFLINFRAHSKNISNYILLIDEPGLHLHPRGQKDTLEELEALAAKRKNQVIYCTHQTFLINKNKPQRVRILERKLDKAGHLAKNPFFASKVSDISNPKETVLRDKLLREALGFAVSDISPINEKNILVEGSFDREILHLVNRHCKALDLNDTSVIACGGASNIAKHARLYKANGLRVVCLYDSDASGISSCRNNDAVRPNEKRQVGTYIKDSKDWQTMEDLIPDELFASAWKNWAKTCKVNAAVPNRPRMRSFDKVAHPDRMMEMKHALEDAIAAEVAKNVQKQEQDFEPIIGILKDLMSRLG